LTTLGWRFQIAQLKTYIHCKNAEASAGAPSFPWKGGSAAKQR
jgi:hypothetical protein